MPPLCVMLLRNTSSLSSINLSQYTITAAAAFGGMEEWMQLSGLYSPMDSDISAAD